MSVPYNDHIAHYTVFLFFVNSSVSKMRIRWVCFASFVFIKYSNKKETRISDISNMAQNGAERYFES